MVGSGRWGRGLGSGRLGLGGIRLGGRLRLGRGLISEPPLSFENTDRKGGEELEETASKIKTAIGTSGTLIGDGSSGLLITDFHDNLPPTVRTRIATAVLSRVQSNNMLVRSVKFAAGAGSSSNIVESPTGAAEPLMKLDRGVGALGELMVTVAATLAMAKVAKDGQRSGESKESEIQAHNELKAFAVSTE